MSSAESNQRQTKLYTDCCLRSTTPLMFVAQLQQCLVFPWKSVAGHRFIRDCFLDQAHY